jgi:hypothetical protein
MRVVADEGDCVDLKNGKFHSTTSASFRYPDFPETGQLAVNWLAALDAAYSSRILPLSSLLQALAVWSFAIEQKLDTEC